MSCRFTLIVLLLCGQLGCAGLGSVYSPAPRHAPLEVVDAVDRVWLCLLHGQGCRHLREHAHAAVVGAPNMVSAQWSRALSGQASADVHERAMAWLNLLTWLELRADSDAISEKLRVIALESLSQLAVRDRRTVVAVTKRRVSAIGAALNAPSSPVAAFRLQRAIWEIHGPAAARFFTAAPFRLPVATIAIQPVHMRMHTGVLALTSPPVVDHGITVRAGAGEPLSYRLPSKRPGVYAVTVPLPARTKPAVLVLRSRLPVAAWLQGQRLEVVTAGGSTTDLTAQLPVMRQHHQLTLAVPLADGGDILQLAVMAVCEGCSGQATGRKASIPAAVWRSIDALWAPGGASGNWLAHRFGHGPLQSMLLLHRQASLSDHQQRTSAAALDELLGFFPGCADARVERAALARDNGDSALARRLLEPLLVQRAHRVDAVAVTPQALLRADVSLEVARQAIGEGLADIALATVEKTAVAQQGDCGMQDAALELALDAMDRSAISRLLRLRKGCRSPSLKVSDAYIALGLLRAAAVELSRAATVAHMADQAGRRAASIAETLDDRRLLAGHRLSQSDAMWRSAQRDLVQTPPGRPRASSSKLDQLLLDPAVRSMETRRGYFLLGARPPWGGFFHDGGEVVTKWRLSCKEDERKCRGEGSPVTWLLDQEIELLLPGGGALRRAHQVIAIHTARAAQSLGELHMPADAQLVLARTYTPDGKQWLPATTPDKESVSLRKVAPGAIVEFVQVQFVAPDDTGAAATRLPVFMLASTDGPVLQSELVLMARSGSAEPPADMSKRAPSPTSRDIVVKKDGQAHATWRTWTWRATDQPRFKPEHRAVRPKWALPAVRVRRNVNLSQVKERFEEVLAAYLSRNDSALTPWLRKAEAAGHDPVRWKKLIAEVARSVRFVRSGTDPGSPAVAARTGKGDRAALLWYLARKTGLGACLARLQPLTKTPPYGPADPRDFAASALKLTFRPTGATPRATWVDPGVEGGTIDYLRPGLRGRRALLLGCGQSVSRGGATTTTQLPDIGSDRDLRRIDVRLRWHKDGGAVAEVQDSMDGALAALVRKYLAQSTNQSRLIEQLAQFALPGWTLQWQGVDGLDTTGAKLTVRYAAALKASVKRSTELTLGLFPARLAQVYARLHERRTDLRFGHALNTVVKLQLTNDGAPLTAALRSVAMHHPRVSLQRTVQQIGARLTLRSHLQSSMGIVKAGRYGAFASTLRQIDRAEVLHLARGAQQ